MTALTSPTIIQGGMGVGVSNWELARAVSVLGEVGVVSGVALAIIMVRRLQLGDQGGHMRRALAAFPIQSMAQGILDKYFIPGGKPADQPFRLLPMPTLRPDAAMDDLIVAANFAEVYLAKEGHNGVVGINYLEKVQLPTLASLCGAMLAGVDYVLMGAGIPRAIPAVLDRLAAGQSVELKINLAGGGRDDQAIYPFDPSRFLAGGAVVRRPCFLAIVSSATLAVTLARKSSGTVDGFVIENASAGGHNAPPRGPLELNADGEPVYGPRDEVDLARFRELGLPFWLAGSYGTPQKLAAARAEGAQGVQVGTPFAFCGESGITPAIKRQVIEMALAGDARVRTDPKASPTGFPFKVLQVKGSLSDADAYGKRNRTCDMGYLRQPSLDGNGGVSYRCPAELVEQFAAKGGDAAESDGRICLCNGLMATVGLGQPLGDSANELPLITAGDDVANLRRYIPPGSTTYSAADVIRYMRGPAA